MNWKKAAGVTAVAVVLCGVAGLGNEPEEPVKGGVAPTVQTVPDMKWQTAYDWCLDAATRDGVSTDVCDDLRNDAQAEGEQPSDDDPAFDCKTMGNRVCGQQDGWSTA